MMEVGRVFQIAEHRHAVHLGAGLGGCCRGIEARRAQRAEAETEHVPAIEMRHALVLQLRFPIRAALSASYHHMVGKPVTPYLASGSGWLKRSHRATR